MSEGGYIQGAGDDSEAWAHGLTPPVFWANKSTLIETAEEELPELIGRLVAEYDRRDTSQQAIRVAPTQNLYISKTDGRLSENGLYDLVIDCNGSLDAHGEDAKRLNLGCQSGKLGGRDLRNRLDKVREFVASHFAQDPSRSLLVMCETGKDLSAGALLAILCIFYNDNGELSQPAEEPGQADQYRDIQLVRRKTAHQQTVYPPTPRMDCVFQARRKPITHDITISQRFPNGTAGLLTAKPGTAPTVVETSLYALTINLQTS